MESKHPAKGEGTPPVESFKAGGMRASVFENKQEDRDGRAYTQNRVVLDRTYKDKEGNWRTTNGFSGIDIPKGILLLWKAFEYISLKPTETTPEGEGADLPVTEEKIQ